jgi:N-acetyltransferase
MSLFSPLILRQLSVVSGEGFDYQPSLSGSLLRLRPLRADDFPTLHTAAADPEIWAQHPDKDRYRAEVFRPYFQTLLNSREALVAIDQATDQVVGMSRYHGYDPKQSEVEVGWTFLARSHWGGAYNRELKALMLSHAFRFVRSVVFLINPENVRSQRAIEKIGGIRFGTRPDGAGQESIAYRIDSATFGQPRSSGS